MATYQSTILATSGLVSYWRLNETSGTTATDLQSGYNGTYHSVTLNNSPIITGDPTAKSGSFVTSSYVSIPNQTALDFTSPYSIEAWVYQTSNVGTQTFFGQTNSGGAGGPSFAFQAVQGSANVAFLQINQGGHIAVTGTVMGGGTGITTNFPIYVGYSFDGNDCIFYIQNFQVIPSPSQLNPGPSSTNNLAIGQLGTTGGQFYTGKLEEVAVYNVALSQATFLAHYQAGIQLGIGVADSSSHTESSHETVTAQFPIILETSSHTEFVAGKLFPIQINVTETVTTKDVVNTVAFGESDTVTTADEVIAFAYVPSSTLPIVLTLPPQAVTPTSAFLLGSVNPDGGETVWWFVWGTTTAYGNSTFDQHAGNGLVPLTVGTTIGDPLGLVAPLTPGQTYHYAVVAQGPGGTIQGADQSFVAQSSPVVVTADAPLVPFTTYVDLPHFAYPLTITPIGARVVEQGVTAEVQSCVTAIVECPIGACPELPSFGIPDSVFGTLPFDTTGMVAAVQNLEPRSNAEAVAQAVGQPEQGVQNVVISNNPTGVTT